MIEIDWNELIQSKKSVRACDKHSCGNVMAEHGNNIIIEGATIKSHEYIVPKSRVDHYDGNDLYLNITRDDIKINPFKGNTTLDLINAFMQPI
jgi:hypothetical protein